jgi:hypothetical protein
MDDRELAEFGMELQEEWRLDEQREKAAARVPAGKPKGRRGTRKEAAHGAVSRAGGAGGAAGGAAPSAGEANGAACNSAAFVSAAESAEDGGATDGSNAAGGAAGGVAAAHVGAANSAAGISATDGGGAAGDRSSDAVEVALEASTEFLRLTGIILTLQKECAQLEAAADRLRTAHSASVEAAEKQLELACGRLNAKKGKILERVANTRSDRSRHAQVLERTAVGRKQVTAANDAENAQFEAMLIAVTDAASSKKRRIDHMSPNPKNVAVGALSWKPGSAKRPLMLG